MAVMDVTYLSAYLKRSIRFKVILPLENTKQPDPDFLQKPEKFKTLYLLHGFSGGENDWLYGTCIYKLARDYNLAVVMPAGENSFYVDAEKRGVNYRDFVAKELVKATRRLFPLSDKWEDTYIGGLSMGGFGALLIGTSYPETFSKIIGLSGAYDLHDPIVQSIFHSPIGFPETYYEDLFVDLTNPKEEADAICSAKKALSKNKCPKMYMACGREDFLFNSNEKTRDLLKGLGADLTWEEGTGTHDWPFWDEYIIKAVKWCME